jgi:hypothetical protein
MKEFRKKAAVMEQCKTLSQRNLEEAAVKQEYETGVLLQLNKGD